MWGIEYVWGWILAVAYVWAPNVRNAINAKGQDLKNVALASGNYIASIGKIWLNGLIWLLIGLIPLLVVGIIWVPPLRVIVFVIGIFWFTWLILAYRGIANIFDGMPEIPAWKKQKDGKEVTVTPAIPLDDIGGVIAAALRATTKPLLFVLGALGLGVLISLAFPGIPGTLALTIFAIFVVRMAVRTYHDKPIGMRYFYAYAGICVIAIVTRLIFPGASEAVDVGIGKIGAKLGFWTAVEDRGTRLIENKTENFPKIRVWRVETGFAWFWRLGPGNTAGPLKHPPIGTHWSVLGEMKIGDLPPEIAGLEGAADMLFLKVQDMKNPTHTGIVRDLWGGGEIDNPFEFEEEKKRRREAEDQEKKREEERRREEEARIATMLAAMRLPSRIICPTGKKLIVKSPRQTYEDGFFLTSARRNFRNPVGGFYHEPIAKGTKIGLFPAKTLAHWQANIFDTSGLIVETFPLDQEHTTQRTGWVCALPRTYKLYKVGTTWVEVKFFN